LLFFVVVLTEQLEVLKLVAKNVAETLNARGGMLVAHLQDVPVRAREVALHGVSHGAAVALAIA
jgi:hypothetical protein